MAVIVAEFHSTCKIEAREYDALLAGKAGGRTEAETACHHSVYRAPGTQRLDALLRQRIHGALVVALRREDAFLSFKQDGHVGRQSLSAASFRDLRNAEYQPYAMSVAARGSTDAHADPVAGRPGAAFALHLGVLPVEVEIQCAANASSQVAATHRKAAGGGRRVCRRIGQCAVREGQHREEADHDAGETGHASTVSRALYCKTKRVQWPNVQHVQHPVDM